MVALLDRSTLPHYTLPRPGRFPDEEFHNEEVIFWFSCRFPDVFTRSREIRIVFISGRFEGDSVIRLRFVGNKT